MKTITDNTANAFLLETQVSKCSQSLQVSSSAISHKDPQATTDDTPNEFLFKTQLSN